MRSRNQISIKPSPGSNWRARFQALINPPSDGYVEVMKQVSTSTHHRELCWSKERDFYDKIIGWLCCSDPEETGLNETTIGRLFESEERSLVSSLFLLCNLSI